MRRVQALAAICISPPHGTPPNHPCCCNFHKQTSGMLGYEVCGVYTRAEYHDFFIVEEALSGSLLAS
jgi:hypothetical protein